MNDRSPVYFADFRTSYTENLLQKLRRLMKRAGFETLDLDGKFVAIKMHFGEPGNLAFLRPNWAKVVADYARERGGKPFLTDCNTLYVGGRKNALDHLDTAEANGFSTIAAGCHVVIADGLKGTDEALVPLAGTPTSSVPLRPSPIRIGQPAVSGVNPFSHAQYRCSSAFLRLPGYIVLQSVRNGFPPREVTTSTTARA